jgi:arylsulfatase A-like enzyme
MKATWWEGGIRVPLLAWGPGILGGGKVMDEPAAILDLFPTVLTAAGVALPKERALDGKDILPMLQGKGASPHEALYSYQNGLRTVRMGEWKLHKRVPPPHPRGADWVDPRAPNGVTLLAPFEQPKADAHPGIQTGDRPAGWALFNLKDDSGEQHDVAGKNPEIVARLKARFESMEAEVNKDTQKPK